MNTMNEQEILVVYERVARLTRQMLDAAQAGKWDRLTVLEKECSAQFAPLVDFDRPSPAGAQTGIEYRRRKAELIHSILADDAQIRMLVEPQLESLSALLGSTRQQQRLVQAYQSDG